MKVVRGAEKLEGYRILIPDRVSFRLFRVVSEAHPYKASFAPEKVGVRVYYGLSRVWVGKDI